MEVITSHINADFDAFASMFAARMLYPEAQLVFPGSQEKSLREYLQQLPENLCSGIIKLKNVKIDTISRLIIVDTRQLSRIGPFAQLIGRDGVEIIIYDHHPPSSEDIPGDQEYCLELGSNITLMIEHLKLKGIQPSAQEATIMAMGIYEDTGNLLFPSTTADDCRALAQLLAWGTDLNEVAKAIARDLGPEQVGVLDQLIKNAHTFQVSGMDVLLSHSESSGYVEDFALLAHKLSSMYNADATFALGLMGERIYLVARSSLPQLDAAKVADHFGGGGHPTAAAASIKDISLQKAEASLRKKIESEAIPRITARDIMTFPVKGLPLDATTNDASKLLNRYNINACVVRSKDERVKGIITRQIVSRAQGHNLGEAKIKDYMIRDFKTVGPNAPVWEIRTLVLEGNQRMLPVVEDGRAIGVIARTDLMMIMHEKMARIEGLHRRSARAKSVASLLKERMPADFFALLNQAGSLAASMGYKLYLVGGIVRDMLLRIDNLDVDLVVEGDGIAFARRFSNEISARVACHDKYKTAVITLAHGRHIDVATARLEYYKDPGGFPVVEESTLKLDLYRRDFTINTMAVALNPASFGQLIDFFGAQRDIKEKRIRVLHSLSFVEDPSRILRAVRFEKRFGFALGKQTLSLVHSAVRSGFLRNIPGRRISHEIQQMLSEDDPLPGMERLQDLGVLSAIHGDLIFNVHVRELFERTRETISWFNLLYTHETIRPWFIFVLALGDQMKPKKITSICLSLGLGNIETRRILAAKANVNEMLKDFSTRQDNPPARVVSTLEGASLEEILFAMCKTRNDEVKEMISAFITSWRHYKPPVTGRDLQDIGFTEGKFLGDCLRRIRDMGLNGEIKDFSEALEFARKMLQEKEGGI